jgi:uncharacterized protein DUF6311
VVRGAEARGLTGLGPGAAIACGALVGLILGLRVLDPQFIAGTGGKWIRPENDYIAYLVAWNYYVIDAWRFPLFELPAMGYPEGGSVLFNDALPLTALLTKALYHAAGVRVNPFGWWILLTYVLQGAMAARIVRAVGVRSLLACAAAAVLAIVNVAFTSRMGHTALSSHFLILWAIALHFESGRQERLRARELVALLAITLLVNAYLFAMVLALAIVTVATLARRRHLQARDRQILGAGAAFVAVLGIAAGYGMLLVNPSTMKSEGFGLYSWNLTSLLLPPNGIAGFLAAIPRYGTHGQYEGEAFVGSGALVLLALCVIVMPATVLQQVRRHTLYVAALAALAVYAASNAVYAGKVLLIEYPLPALAVDLGNYFRATGRFIWPLAYSVAILPLALIFRTWRTAPAAAAAVLAVILQVHEAADVRRSPRRAADARLAGTARAAVAVPLMGVRRIGAGQTMAEPRRQQGTAAAARGVAGGRANQQRVHVPRAQGLFDRGGLAQPSVVRAGRPLRAGPARRPGLAGARRSRAFRWMRRARLGDGLLDEVAADHCCRRTAAFDS